MIYIEEYEIEVSDMDRLIKIYDESKKIFDELNRARNCVWRVSSDFLVSCCCCLVSLVVLDVHDVVGDAYHYAEGLE